MIRVFTTALALLAATGASHAVTVLSVVDTTPDSSIVFSDTTPGATGFTFSTNASLANVSINVNYLCVGSCSVSAFLVDEVGPTAGLGDLFASASLDGSSSLVFSGLDLAADNYAVVFAQDTGLVGFGLSDLPVVTTAGQAAATGTITTAGANFNAVTPFGSQFSSITPTLLYSIEEIDIVTPPVATVPLGATAPFLGSALLGLTAMRRRLRS